MSLPKDPRQKMINMMYLVLIALLALNVSAEILNAFKTVEQSLKSSIEIVDKKSEDLIKSLEKKAEDPKTKAKASYWLPIAQKAKDIAHETFDYIENLKKELKEESGLKIENGKEVFKEDDLDAPTRLFISKKPIGKEKGTELYKKLENFRNQLVNLDPKIKLDVEKNLPLNLNIQISENGETEAWEYGYFHMTPTIAALTILTKFQSDVRNSEQDIIAYCHKEIGEVELIYDEFAALAVSNSQYFLPGDDLIIRAGVGAFSKAAKPQIYVDGQSIPLKTDGLAEYTLKIGEGYVGEQSKKVKIVYAKPDGTVASVEKIIKYNIGLPSGLVVSTDKTRVFYKGLDNPVTINGSGGDENIQVSILDNNAASIRKESPGKYIINCNSIGLLTLNVKDGKENKKISIPVKKVPDPLATVNGSAGGTMGANLFRVQRGIGVDLKDFVFDGVKFSVNSFSLIFSGKGFEEAEWLSAQGNSFNKPDVQSKIKRCVNGTNVTIFDITVTEPGGGTRKLEQNMTFILQ